MINFLLTGGFRKMLGVFLQPGIFFALSVVGFLAAGVAGVWWGLQSNHYRAEVWRTQALHLQQAVNTWESIAAQDSVQALKDQVVIDDAVKSMEGFKKDDESSNIARWDHSDLRMFNKIRNGASGKN